MDDLDLLYSVVIAIISAINLYTTTVVKDNLVGIIKLLHSVKAECRCNNGLN